VHPARLGKQLQTSLKLPLGAFKAARLFDPRKVQEMKLVSSSVNELNCFPFITTEKITGLKPELP